MQVCFYNKLNDDIRKIRTEVFIKEQGFQNEFDELDEISTHVIVLENKKPIATARYYYDNKKESYILGRIAVLKEYRKNGTGTMILNSIQDSIKQKGAKSIMLLSQERAKGFYKKSGFEEFGDIIYDEFCPHVWMKKDF